MLLVSALHQVWRAPGERQAREGQGVVSLPEFKNYGRLSFRRFVLFACSLPDLPRRIGVEGGDT